MEFRTIPLDEILPKGADNIEVIEHLEKYHEDYHKEDFILYPLSLQGRLSSSINMYHDLIHHLKSKIERPVSNKKDIQEQKETKELFNALDMIAGSLEKISNSASMREKRAYTFDMVDLRNSLEHATIIIDRVLGLD